MSVRSEDQILPGGMEVGRPRHRTKLRELAFVTAIDLHGHHFRRRTIR